jgi:hypothetical protein
MYNSVRDPSQEIEDCVFVGRQNVAQVGAIENVLESGEDADPDRRSVVSGNIFAA